MSCEYCNGNVPRVINSETNTFLDVYKSGDKFRIDYLDDIYGMQSELIKFNNCPMCGRKLEGADSNE